MGKHGFTKLTTAWTCEKVTWTWGKATTFPFIVFSMPNHGAAPKCHFGNLTLNLSFGHNLCFNYPNGSCEPILNIEISKAFQWYKELFNPMSFDPYDHPLKFHKSIGTPIPKVETHLGMWGFIPSHSLTLSGA
jgi:hypothetical protein